MPVISELWVYPVKALQGISVSQWQATSKGLDYDRQWMLVGPNGRFVSQRQFPPMALIKTTFEGDELRLSREGFGSCWLPLKRQAKDSGQRCTGAIWRDECDLLEASLDVSAWINQVLRPPKPLQLVQLAREQRRKANPHRFGNGTYTHFADAAPYLIANQNSLRALNQQLVREGKAPVDIRRFRPNVVLEGLTAFAEQTSKYRQLTNSTGHHFQLIDRCERCVVTTINPDTAERAKDWHPYRTLAHLNPVPGRAGAAAFGMNASFLGGSAELKVGETLAQQ